MEREQEEKKLNPSAKLISRDLLKYYVFCPNGYSGDKKAPFIFSIIDYTTKCPLCREPTTTELVAAKLKGEV